MRRLPVVLAAFAFAACGGSRDDVSRGQLALMPLPKSAYGPAAAGLTIDSQSGVVDNADAARGDLDTSVTVAYLKRLGRVTGYTLDFSNVRAFAAGSGVVDVASGVDVFADEAGAQRYVEKQLAEPRELTRARSAIAFRNLTWFRIPLPDGAARGVSGELRLGGSSFWLTFSLFRRGTVVGEVALTNAGGFGDQRQQIAQLTRALDRRVRDGLDGKLRGKPLPLPPATRAKYGGLGPPKGGPELADAALARADFSAAQLVADGYTRDPTAVANFLRRFEAAQLGSGRLNRVDVNVQLHPSAKDAVASLITRRATVAGGRGRALLAQAFSSALARRVRPGELRIEEPQALRAGDEAFALHATVGRTPLVIAMVAVGSVDQTVTMIGAPGAALSQRDVSSLLRRAARRMRDALAARAGTGPA